MKNLIDVHCHLDHERFKEDLDEVIKRAERNGVGLIIAAGINPSTNRKILEISKKYPIVKPSFGIYPTDAIAEKLNNLKKDELLHEAEVFSLEKELEWIEKNYSECIAIGEVGLDYKVLPDTESLQKEAFQKIILLAKKIKKPLIIHSRKAEADAIKLLEKNQFTRVNMHCFSAKKSLIKKCVENGYFLSVPPVITRLEHFKMLVKIVPLTQLLTETDSPFLSPVAGERNEPANIKYSIEEIAKIKEKTKEEVASRIFNNARRLFKI
ncbi:TatD family deoxyribonuclease [Candidatus Pacearchaeota archaeon]|nr:MAG: TatD family deoxyribonuclease [Candidatus Pacearchaeota archaeon]